MNLSKIGPYVVHWDLPNSRLETLLPDEHRPVLVTMSNVLFYETFLDFISKKLPNEGWWNFRHCNDMFGAKADRSPSTGPGDYAQNTPLGTVLIIAPSLALKVINSGWRLHKNAKVTMYDLKLHLIEYCAGKTLADHMYYEIPRQSLVKSKNSVVNLSRDLSDNIEHMYNEVFRAFLKRMNVLDRPELPLKKTLLPPLGPDPLITVLIRCGQDRGFLPACMESVMEGGWENMEIVLVDDAPSPRVNPQSWPKARWVREGRVRGLSAALNVGFRHSRGEIVIVVDDDDVLAPGCLEKIVRYMQKHPNLGYATAQYMLMSNDGRPLGEDSIVTHKYNDVGVLLRYDGSGAPKIWRPSVFTAIGGADEEILYGEDLDMSLKAGEVTEVGIVPEVLYYYRMHSTQSDAMAFNQRMAHKLRIRLNALKRRTRTQPIA